MEEETSTYSDIYRQFIMDELSNYHPLFADKQDPNNKNVLNAIATEREFGRVAVDLTNQDYNVCPEFNIFSVLVNVTSNYPEVLQYASKQSREKIYDKQYAKRSGNNNSNC